jgi:hypothetical protein
MGKCVAIFRGCHVFRILDHSSLRIMDFVIEIAPLILLEKLNKVVYDGCGKRE